MGLNTYPANPFPPSTDQMDADALEAEVSKLNNDVGELKSGLTNYENQNNLNLEVPNRKNVLPNGVKSGSFAGVEWTLNDDGSITFNGTATQQIFNKMYFSKDLDLPVGEYIYNGGSALITFQLANKAESQAYYSYADYSGYIEVTQAMVGDMIARLIINNGTVLNNVTIYPMIRPKSIESGVYAPYIPSVESRIEAVESGLTNMELLVENSNTLNIPGIMSKYKQFLILAEGIVEGSQNVIGVSCIIATNSIKSVVWRNRYPMYGDVVLYAEIPGSGVSANGFSVNIASSDQQSTWVYSVKAIYGFN